MRRAASELGLLRGFDCPLPMDSSSDSSCSSSASSSSSGSTRAARRGLDCLRARGLGFGLGWLGGGECPESLVASELFSALESVDSSYPLASIHAVQRCSSCVLHLFRLPEGSSSQRRKLMMWLIGYTHVFGAFCTAQRKYEQLRTRTRLRHLLRTHACLCRLPF